MATQDALIEWTDEFSVGVDSIDEQHKRLVNMINDLNSAMEQGRTDGEMSKIFSTLLVYTHEHFEYEEKLFAQVSYVAAAAHEREHDALREKVVALKGRIDRGEFVLGVEVMSFLREWLINHILVSDMAYSKTLQENGIK